MFAHSAEGCMCPLLEENYSGGNFMQDKLYGNAPEVRYSYLSSPMGLSHGDQLESNAKGQLNVALCILSQVIMCRS